MTTLVTGGTGFVGVNVVRDLAAAGHAVVSVDVGEPDELTHDYLAPWREHVTWITADARDPGVLDRVAANHSPEYVVHAAAYTPYGDEEAPNFRRTMDNNAGCLLNVIDVAKAHDVKRVIAISTIGVYTSEYFTEPQEHLLVREDQPLDPHHVYGISKIASEALLRRATQLFGFESASVRLAQNWGPMERLTPFHSRMSIPYYWARQAANREEIVASPFGSGITDGRRLNQDHPYVLDTAAAVRLLLEAERLSHSVYNVSAGGPIFVDDMVAALKRVAPDVPVASPVPVDNADTSYGIGFAVERLREDTAFSPEFDLAGALAHCIEWRRRTGFLSD
jgi:UDP-glucose 4-epimerase